MDSREARFILQAYRPNGQDAHDPQFREALALVEKDPELRQWFHEQQAIDAAISAKLKAAPVPAELKDNILTGTKVIPQNKVWWRQALVATAACLLIAVAGVRLWRQFQPIPSYTDPLDILGYSSGFELMDGCAAPITLETSPKFTRYCVDMVKFLGQLDHLDKLSNNPQELRQWLAKSKGHADFVLPAGLSRQPPQGCRVLDWNGKRVTLMCFNPGTGQFDKKVHLLIINRADAPDGPPPGIPVFLQYPNVATASWTKDDKTYILVCDGQRDYLHRYFAQAGP
ncbi:MAG: hypothetical protein AB1705_23535 [Verrucomicrobiota bacterium]